MAFSPLLQYYSNKLYFHLFAHLTLPFLNMGLFFVLFIRILQNEYYYNNASLQCKPKITESVTNQSTSRTSHLSPNYQSSANTLTPRAHAISQIHPPFIRISAIKFWEIRTKLSARVGTSRSFQMKRLHAPIFRGDIVRKEKNAHGYMRR